MATLCVAILLVLHSPLHAQANSTILLQGKIVNKTTGTNLIAGTPSCVNAGVDTCRFRVSIYDASSGGTLLWQETHSNIELGSNNGIFSLQLNSICNSWTAPSGSCSGAGITWGSNPNLYIQMEFDSGGGTFTETFQRKVFNSVPFAYYADSAGSIVGGLDTVYANDSDKVLVVNNIAGLKFQSTTSGAINFDLQSTGNVTFTNPVGNFLTLANNGAITYTLDATNNPNYTVNNLGTGSFIINDQASDTSPFVIDQNGNVGIGVATPTNILDIANSGTTDSIRITNSSTGTGLNIIYSGTGTTATGLSILNNTTGAITTAVDLSDPEIVNAISLGNNNILSNTDATVSWNNVAGRELVRLSDISANFGASLDAGAFISRNSYVGEEFSRDRADINANGSQVWGDFQQFGVDETTNCIFSTVNNAVNGIGRIATNANGTHSCLAYHSTANGVAQSQFNATNLPLIMMKVRPSNVSATDQLWVGIGDSVAATNTAPTNGIFFTNNGGTNWTGVTRSGGVSTAVNCGVAISTTQFALLKIEVRSTTDVRFYIDADVSNGVSWTSCGTSTTDIPTINLTSMLMYSATATGRNLDIDYYRVWQDDNVINSTAPAEVITQSNYENQVGGLITNLASPDQLTILEDMLNDKQSLSTKPSNQITADRVLAGLDIITPQVITDNLQVNTITPTSGDLNIELGADQQIIIKSNNKDTAISFDNLGNANFSGTLSAQTIKADRIEGLEIYAGKLDDLSSTYNGLTHKVDELQNQSIFDKLTIRTAEVTLDLKVLGLLTASGGLTVDGNALFNGQVQFNQAVNFAANSTFNGDVQVKGRLSQNADAGGFATVKRGSDKVVIKFQKAYAQTPIISINITTNDESEINTIFAANINYLVTDVSNKGFTIRLNKAAPLDLKFNWSVTNVYDATNTDSKPAPAAPSPVVTEPQPTPQPDPQTSTTDHPTKSDLPSDNQNNHDSNNSGPASYPATP